MAPGGADGAAGDPVKPLQRRPPSRTAAGGTAAGGTAAATTGGAPAAAGGGGLARPKTSGGLPAGGNSRIGGGGGGAGPGPAVGGQAPKPLTRSSTMSHARTKSTASATTSIGGVGGGGSASLRQLQQQPPPHTSAAAYVQRPSTASSTSSGSTNPPAGKAVPKAAAATAAQQHRRRPSATSSIASTTAVAASTISTSLPGSMGPPPPPPPAASSRPAFTTHQQHFTPMKAHPAFGVPARKATTAAVMAAVPATPSRLPPNAAAAAANARLQTTLLQLHLLHADAHAVHDRWRADAKSKLAERFEDVRAEMEAVQRLEAEVRAAHDLRGLVRWGMAGVVADDDDGGGATDEGRRRHPHQQQDAAAMLRALEERLQRLGAAASGAWELASEPAGRYGRVVARFEAWAAAARRAAEARRRWEEAVAAARRRRSRAGNRHHRGGGAGHASDSDDDDDDGHDADAWERQLLGIADAAAAAAAAPTSASSGHSRGAGPASPARLPMLTGELEAEWHDECAALVRRLDEWRRLLRGLEMPPGEDDYDDELYYDGATSEDYDSPHATTSAAMASPRAGPGIAHVLSGSRALVHDMLAELHAMESLQRDVLAAENAWVRRMNRLDDGDAPPPAGRAMQNGQGGRGGDTPRAGAVWRTV